MSPPDAADVVASLKKKSPQSDGGDGPEPFAALRAPPRKGGSGEAGAGCVSRSLVLHVDPILDKARHGPLDDADIDPVIPGDRAETGDATFVADWGRRLATVDTGMYARAVARAGAADAAGATPFVTAAAWGQLRQGAARFTSWRDHQSFTEHTLAPVRAGYLREGGNPMFLAIPAGMPLPGEPSELHRR
eukprot:gene52784-9617_t